MPPFQTIPLSVIVAVVFWIYFVDSLGRGFPRLSLYVRIKIRKRACQAD